MNSVREVGNIGAHMEKNINQIVDVDPDEAQLLIKLIEMLVNETYILSHSRSKNMQAVKELAADKKRIKEGPTIENEAQNK